MDDDDIQIDGDPPQERQEEQQQEDEPVQGAPQQNPQQRQQQAQASPRRRLEESVLQEEEGDDETHFNVSTPLRKFKKRISFKTEDGQPISPINFERRQPVRRITTEEYRKERIIVTIKKLRYHIELYAQENIWKNDRIQKSAYPTEGSGEKLLDLFYNLFTDGFNEFDKSSLEIVSKYLEGCYKLYNDTTSEKCRENLGGLCQFLVISILCGPDRAITSINANDELWRNFKTDVDDFFHTKIYDTTKANIKVPSFRETRNLYYSFFRHDDFKPENYKRTFDIDSLCQESERRETQGRNPGTPIHESTRRTTGKSEGTLSQSGRRSSLLQSLRALEDKNEDNPPMDFDPPPAKPYHSTIEDIDQQQPLALLGHVYDPRSPATTIIKTQPKTPGILKETLECLGDLEINDQLKGLILGSAVGVAQGISSMTKDYKDRNKKTIQAIPPPPANQDLRIDSFDYNIYGQTPSEILGNRFSNTRFPSEGARIETMKALYQRVINDPRANQNTIAICLNQLGQLDPPKQYILNAKYAAAQALESPEAAYGFIKPPLLGDGCIDNNVSKAYHIRFDKEDRYNIETSGVSALRKMLEDLSEIITTYQLKERDAYSLLRKSCSGVSQERVSFAETVEKIPFNELWMSLQRTHQGAVPTKEHQKKLKTIITSDKCENLGKTLTEICLIVGKLHEQETDNALRNLLRHRDSLKYLREFIHRFYPSHASHVESLFKDALRREAFERNIPEFQREEVYHQGKIQILIDVACSILRTANANTFDNKSSKGDKNIFVSAIETTEQPQQAPPQENQQQNQGYRNQQYQYRQNNDPRRQLLECYLCGRKGHSFRLCRTYLNEQPGKDKCTVCGGRHTSACVLQQIREKQQQQPNKGLKALDYQQQPEQQQNQQQQQNNYNRPNSQRNYNPRRSGYNRNNNNGSRSNSNFQSRNNQGYNGGYRRNNNYQQNQDISQPFQEILQVLRQQAEANRMQPNHSLANAAPITTTISPSQAD